MNTITFKDVDELNEELIRLDKLFNKNQNNEISFFINWTNNTITYNGIDPITYPYYSGKILNDFIGIISCYHCNGYSFDISRHNNGIGGFKAKCLNCKANFFS